MFNNKHFLIILTTFWTISIANAPINQTQLQKIESLIATWNISNTPGVVIGIMEQGKIVYTKGFGVASLDYDIPNTENTLFNIGSVSIQMTAMGIVKLHIAGHLSIDDDIRKYVPKVPDFGHPITIRYLLHHTSGLRDFSIADFEFRIADLGREIDNFFFSFQRSGIGMLFKFRFYCDENCFVI